MRFLLLLLPSLLAAQTFDIVLQRGLVMYPESNLDAVRSIGIKGKKIVAISTRPLRGKVVVDATGLVVAPGFIDLHSHGQTPGGNGAGCHREPSVMIASHGQVTNGKGHPRGTGTYARVPHSTTILIGIKRLTSKG